MKSILIVGLSLLMLNASNNTIAKVAKDSRRVDELSNLTPQQKTSKSLIRDSDIKRVAWTSKLLIIYIQPEGKSAKEWEEEKGREWRKLAGKEWGKAACDTANRFSATPREKQTKFLVWVIDYDLWISTNKKHKRVWNIYRCNVSDQGNLN